jgi:CYTH domain-containing protein
MARETERKFLVKGEFRHLATRMIEITQCYLLKDRDKTIRLRIAGDEGILTIKSSAPEGKITRGEWEFPVSLVDALDIFSLCLPGKIVKTRYLVPSGKHTIEVDVFHDKNEGLIIAEIELEFEDEKFEKPEWLGEEVTGRPEYFNSSLAK